MRLNVLNQWYGILIVSLIASSFTYANTGKITGRVTDKKTGEPLPGVNVLVETTPLGAATDNNGEYVILNIPPGSYTLRASYIGYSTYRVQNLRVSMEQTTWQHFSLSEEVLAGEEINVIAERSMVQRDLTASQKTTTAEEIKAMPVENFMGVLTTQAGVNTGADGALHIRGGRSNEVGYFIDGIAVTNPFFTNSLAIDVSNKALEEMKVVSGAFNAEYGNAMSGIVNLQIKEGGNSYHGSISSYTGDYISDNTNLYMNIDNVSLFARKVTEGTLNGPVPFISGGGKFTFNITGKVYDNEGYLFGLREHSPGDYAFFDITGLYLYQMGGDSAIVPMNPNKGQNFLTKLTYRITPRLKISTQFLHSSTNYKNYVHKYKYNPDGISSRKSFNNNYSLKINQGITKNSFYEANLFISTTNFKKYLSDPIDLESALPEVDPLRDDFYITYRVDTTGRKEYILQNHSYYETLRIFGEPSSATFYFGGTERSHIYRKSVSLGGEIEFTSQVNSKHELKTGISFREDDLDERYIEILFDGITYKEPTILAENTTSSHSHYSQKALFASSYIQDKIEYQNFIMNIGIRYDYFNPNSKYVKNLLQPTGERLKATPKKMISPRIGVAFPITDEGILHFSYGHFYQMPTLRRLYKEPVFGVTGTPEIGYANLRPEKTVLYEFGLQQQLTRVLAIESTVFYKDIRDLLALQTIRYKGVYGPASYKIYQNKDYGSVKGLTISLTKRYDPVTKLSAFLDYTYQLTEGNNIKEGSFFFNAYTGIEEEKKIVPLNWDQTHILNTTATFSEPNNWSFSIIAKTASGWPYTPTYPKYTDLQNINPDPNSGRKPWQSSLDLLFQKTFRVQGMNLVFFTKIYNLFDTRNEKYVFDDTGRAGYTFINRSQQETETFKNHYGEPGIHTWSEYQTRPNYYRAPRLITVGFSLDF